MSTLSDPRSSIEVELLRVQPLKNEEIVELTSFICQAESIDPYIDHIVTLRDRYDMSIEIRPLEVEILSLREKFPLRVLRNFYIAIADVGYHGLVLQVITLYQQDPAASVYLMNLESVFAIQPDEEFVRDTLEVIDKSDMDGPGINAIVHFLEGKLRNISEYAPIPTYIRDFDIDASKLPELQPSDIIDEVNPELIAKYIQERLQGMDQYLEIPSGESAELVLTKMVSSLPAEQYDDLISKMSLDPEEVKRIQENPDIFRVYGPVNPYPDTDFSALLDDNEEPDVNVIFGGARMFTDLSQEIDPETSVPLDEWFTGYCMQCSRRIRAYHHAVREPGIVGGWNGCFCSWDCVRGAIRDGQSGFIFDGDADDPDRLNMYAIQLALTIQMEDKMKEIMIANRDYETEDEYIDTIREDQLSQDLTEKLKANLLSIDLNRTTTYSI
jgi:hypothetical protein